MKDENIANYADDNTPYELENDIDAVLNKLERDSVILLHWFAQNAAKANPEKAHLLLSNINLNLSANFGGNQISKENNVKILGITFDNFNRTLSLEESILYTMTLKLSHLALDTQRNKISAILRIVPKKSRYGNLRNVHAVYVRRMRATSGLLGILFFSSVVENLDVEGFKTDDFAYNLGDSPIENIIRKFRNHPSIVKIKETVSVEVLFHFPESKESDSSEKIVRLDIKKPTTYKNIPTKLLVETSDVILRFLTKINNDAKLYSNFPNPLKLAGITPTHKRTRTITEV